jgi:PhnB protein
METNDFTTAIAGATITAMIGVRNAVAAIEFYKHAFDAVEMMRLNEDDGRVSHCELKIGGATLMLADEYPEINHLGPETIGGSPVILLLMVPDVDTVFQRAVSAGATVTRPLQDGFDGALRTAKLTDPFGHHWMIATQRGEIG